MAAQVYVVDVFGQGASEGTIPAQVNMLTNFGTILTVSGLLVEVCSGSNSNAQMEKAWYQDYQLETQRSHVTTNWGWPTGNCFPSDRHNLFPEGFVGNIDSMSGSTYFDGNAAHTFGR